MKHKKTLIVAVAAVLVLGGASSLASLQHPNQKGVEDRRNEPATLVQQGKITERQRQHSKLFKHSGRKLLDIAATQAGVLGLKRRPGILSASPGKREPFLFSNLHCAMPMPWLSGCSTISLHT